jgi:uncharacterized protein
MNSPAPKSLHSLIAFLSAIPIAILGGLIGLGGAEYRLPVLVGLLKRQAREAVTINLAVSLVTLVSSLIVRSRVVAEFPLMSLMPILGSMIAGAMLAAFVAAGFASKLSSHVLERWIKVLLISIGTLLIIESFLPEFSLNLVNSPLFIQILVGVVAGVLIGIVSSTLGVAGGELIIPTLIFIFGVGVKLAGTASLIISIPTVSIGLIRYYHARIIFDRVAFLQIVVPMAVGSVIGSLIGGSLLGFFSDSALKLILGVVLIISALRMFVSNN